MRTEMRRRRDLFVLRCLCQGIVMKQQKPTKKKQTAELLLACENDTAAQRPSAQDSLMNCICIHFSISCFSYRARQIPVHKRVGVLGGLHGGQMG